MKRIYVLWLLLIIAAICVITTCYVADTKINWTEDELIFMENHPVIQLGVDPRFVPFEFIDEDGEHRGIAADYLSLVSEKTGLQFEVRKDLSWPEAYDLALTQRLDALPAIGKTPERERHFLFSEPYYFFKRVIATKDTDVHILPKKKKLTSTIDGLTWKHIWTMGPSSAQL